MILQIFNQLSQALASNPAIALLASFVWGMLSVLLSPCHLASIPLIVGYLDNQKDLSTKNAFRLSAFFTLGILAMMAIIGLITGLLGKMLGDLGNWTEPVMGLIFMIMAVFIADIIQMPAFLRGGAGKSSRKGIWGALSLIFAGHQPWGPVPFAFMAPILGIVFTSAGSQFLFALTLVLALHHWPLPGDHPGRDLRGFCAVISEMEQQFPRHQDCENCLRSAGFYSGIVSDPQEIYLN